MSQPVSRCPFKQQDVILRGHAMELRIYAEDPDNNFFPRPDASPALCRPSGPGIRRDTGVYEGWVVPLDYDPLLASSSPMAKAASRSSIACAAP